MELIIDDREPEILKSNFEHYVNYSCKIDRITVGDYIVVFDEQILACIERKTWTDLAQSFKDGRKNNIDKMINLRESTGCHLYYLIEGSPFHGPTKKFSGIEFKSLMAHLDHCAMRSHFNVIFCKDVHGVLPRIGVLMDNCRSLMPLKTGGSQKHLLKENIPKTDSQCMANLWECLSGVSSKTSSLLVSNDVSIRSVYSGERTQEDLASLKYDNGNTLGACRAKKIIDGVHGKESTILSRIRGVSKNTAHIILSAVQFSDILTGAVSAEALCAIQLSSKRLGPVLAARILKYLSIP